MTKPADIAVRVGADIDPLTRDLKRGSKQVKSFGKDALEVAGKVTKFGAALSVAAGTGLALITKETAAAARETKNLAFVANVGVEDFQRLAFAAKSVGIESDKYSDILKDVNDRIGDFINTGGGPMADFFEKIGPKIGVTIDQFKRLSGQEALQLFQSSLERANLSQEEMTFYMEAMASDATALIPLLKNNGKGFEDLAKKADKFNIVLSKTDIDQLDKVEAAFGDISASITGAKNEVVKYFIPEVENLKTVVVSIVQKFTELLKGMSAARKEAEIQAGKESEINDIIGRRINTRGRTVALASQEADETNRLLERQEKLNELLAKPDRAGRGSLGRVSEAQKANRAALEEEKAQNDIRIEQLKAQSSEAQRVYDIRKGTLETETKINEVKTAAAVAPDAMGPFISPEMAGDRKAQNEADLAIIKEKYLAEQELLREHQNELAIIGFDFDQAKFTNEEEWRNVREQAIKAHEEKIAEMQKAKMSEVERFRAQSFQNQVKQVSSSLVEMTAGVAQHSKTMFRINKAAGIANAIVNTAQGITKALATYPPPISFVMAAAQAAAGFAQISAIRSSSFNGGGSGRAPSSSATEATAVTQSSPQSQSSQQSEPTRMYVDNLDVHSILSGRTVIDIINRAQADGAVLSVGGRS